MIRNILVISFILMYCIGYSQTERTCGTDLYHQIQMQDAKFAEQFKARRKAVKEKVLQRQNFNCTDIITIPVAVHFSGGVNASNMPCLIDATLA